jgi:uncharacterized damage-inducible protein DinB
MTIARSVADTKAAVLAGGGRKKLPVIRRSATVAPLGVTESLLAAWRTSNRVTVELIESLPPALWTLAVPGVPRRTIRDVAAHLHNTRCAWIRTLGEEHGIAAPARVDRRRVTRRQLAAALNRSSAGMEALFDLGLASDGRLPPSRGYVWRNLALDVGHVLTYFVAHDAHHRGQLVMAARQLGHRLPGATTAALWQWKARHEGSSRSRRRMRRRDA